MKLTPVLDFKLAALAKRRGIQQPFVKIQEGVQSVEGWDIQMIDVSQGAVCVIVLNIKLLCVGCILGLNR